MGVGVIGMRSNTCGKRWVRQEMGEASNRQKKVMGKGKQQARESGNTCGKRRVRQATGKERDR